jgi:hypothetical protein
MNTGQRIPDKSMTAAAFQPFYLFSRPISTTSQQCPLYYIFYAMQLGSRQVRSPGVFLNEKVIIALGIPFNNFYFVLVATG